MRRILKEVLPVEDMLERSSILHLPKDYSLLHISQENGNVTVFFEFDTQYEKDTLPVAFRLFETGQIISNDFTYVGTVTKSGEYHLYEEDIPSGTEELPEEELQNYEKEMQNYLTYSNALVPNV